MRVVAACVASRPAPEPPSPQRACPVPAAAGCGWLGNGSCGALQQPPRIPSAPLVRTAFLTGQTRAIRSACAGGARGAASGRRETLRTRTRTRGAAWRMGRWPLQRRFLGTHLKSDALPTDSPALPSRYAIEHTLCRIIWKPGAVPRRPQGSVPPSPTPLTASARMSAGALTVPEKPAPPVRAAPFADCGPAASSCGVQAAPKVQPACEGSRVPKAVAFVRWRPCVASGARRSRAWREKLLKFLRSRVAIEGP